MFRVILQVMASYVFLGPQNVTIQCMKKDGGLEK
jgi:hypothetical protein